MTGREREGGTLPEREDRTEDATLDTLQRILPPPLVPIFDRSFVRSCAFYDEYVYRLTLQIFREAGLEEATRDPGTVAEVALRAGLDAGQALVPLEWILRTLAGRGAIERLGSAEAAPGSIAPTHGPSAPVPSESDPARSELLEAPGARLGNAREPAPASAARSPGPARAAAPGPARFRSRHLPAPDPGEILEEQRGHDPTWLPSYTVAQVAATDYPAFLKGTVAGEAVLFSPSRLALWYDYFSNDNGLYAVNNKVGALAVEEWLPTGAAHAARGGDGPVSGARFLELGGGLGSAAVALLDRFRDTGRLAEIGSYRFTELVPAFLRRAQRMLAERYAAPELVSFARLDMDKSFGEQGVAEASADLVYAVNTVHIARDLAYTLREIRRALAPGGMLVLSECVRPVPGQPIYVELIFNLMPSFRAPHLDAEHRSNGGFLTPEQWTGALREAGFTGVRFYPDMERIRRHFSVFYVAAVGAMRPA